MVSALRIKEYRFPINTGSQTTAVTYSDCSINGEILRVMAWGNFTGSVILKESGTSYPICNYSVTSGTNVYTPLNFTNTTGSFVLNSPLQLTVGSLASGTAVTYGPVSVLYR